LKKLILRLLVLINSKIGAVKIIMKNAATVVLICFLYLLDNLDFRDKDLYGHRRYDDLESCVAYSCNPAVLDGYVCLTAGSIDRLQLSAVGGRADASRVSPNVT